MVIDGIILSIIVGFIRKGNLYGLAELSLKGALIFPAILLIQVFIYIFQERSALVMTVSVYVIMVVYVVGLYFLWLNRNLHGFMLIFVGVFLNFLVMAVNGGRMPVSLEAAEILDPMYVEVLVNGVYAKHTALTESTRLAFLGDVIPINIPFRMAQVVSIGDVIMNIGIFLFIQHLMLSHKKYKKKELKVS